MKARKEIFIRSSLNKLATKWAAKIFVCSLLLVLVSTLFPFNFSFKNGFFIKEIADSFNNSSDLTDQVANVLLFLPLGFGFTCLLQRRKLRATAKLGIVLIVSAGLSFIVEVLQAFLPSRSPTITDIVTNSLGGSLGSLCFHLWRFEILGYTSAFIRKSKNCLSIKKLIACFIGYISLIFLILSVLASPTSLRNWDLTFSLLLGNERTGDRPWQGYVSKVYIADKAISEKDVARGFSDKQSFAIIDGSLLASYQLAGKGSYRDQTKHLPDLIWRGQPLVAQTEIGVFLNSSHWLETANPTTLMTQRIRESSQFTLSTTVATADTAQAGPARIVSLSSDSKHRNFTLGQEGANLIFRLRTLISGENGVYPELIVPDVFTNTNFHQIVITYSNSVLQIYIDELQNLHSFDLSEMAPKSYKILCYGLIFVPLGYLLALMSDISKGQSIFYFLIIYSVILLLPLLLAGILVSESGQSISLENLLLSVLITSGTIIMYKVQIPSW
jgi:glycopeptide antibiotics resistance protein